MSRKDTIIIAVLVNAGLLMALFATAMRSNKKEESKAQAEIAVAEKPAESLVETMPVAQAENILDASIGGQATLDETSADILGEEIDIATLTPTISQVPAEVAQEPAAPKEVVAASVETKAEPTTISVTVKKGDVLEKIARHNNSTVALIMKANNLSSSNLKIGQVLKVPQKGSKETATTTAVAKAESSEAEYYTVKEGDSPWLIASRNKVKLDDLLRLNGMDEQKAKRLRPGDKLRIR